MADYGGGMSLSQPRALSHTSSDDDDRTPSLLAAANPGSGGMSVARLTNSGSGGEMGEVVRKARGRPPGSKNKPKPPIVITREVEPPMKPVVLEISPGSDVVEQVTDYSRRRNVGLTVLSGCGSVSNVTLRHPLAHAPTISLHGPLHIVGLSGTYLGPVGSATAVAPSSSFSISLAGSQGQVFGGIIAGKVTAQTPVVVVVATFSNPAFIRLPAGAGGEAEEGEDMKDGGVMAVGGGGGMMVSGGGGSGMVVSGGDSGGGGGRTVAYNIGGATGMSCQISPDAMHWGSSPPTRSQLF